MNDASGNPTTDKGKYVEVWEKQADGNWKCGTDTWNSRYARIPVRRDKVAVEAAVSAAKNRTG